MGGCCWSPSGHIQDVQQTCQEQPLLMDKHILGTPAIGMSSPSLVSPSWTRKVALPGPPGPAALLTPLQWVLDSGFIPRLGKQLFWTIPASQAGLQRAEAASCWALRDSLCHLLPEEWECLGFNKRAEPWKLLVEY